MLFFTSDLHFGHDKPFIYGPRGFADVEEMDEAIVRIWNETVADDDDVYVLGDIMLIDNDLGIELWNRLRGRKHVIIGNHDTAPRVELLRKCRNTKVVGYADLIRYKGYSIYVSHYPTMTGNYDESKFMKNCVTSVSVFQPFRGLALTAIIFLAVILFSKQFSQFDAPLLKTSALPSTPYAATITVGVGDTTAFFLCPASLLSDGYRRDIFDVRIGGEPRIRNLAPAARYGHEMIQRYAHVDLLHVPADRLLGFERMFLVEMIARPVFNNAPRLQINRRRRPANRFERLVRLAHWA